MPLVMWGIDTASGTLKCLYNLWNLSNLTMSLTFHQTFSLDCENLAKLLSMVGKHPLVTNKEIADATGIGIGKDERKGKVQPMIDYATYGGLVVATNESEYRRLEYTNIGKIVLQNDEWLKKPSTQWVLHYYLSREGSEAEAWTFFINKFLPRYVEFNRSDLENELDQQFGNRAKVKSINPGVLLNTYLDGNGLGRIRLIREQPKRSYMRTQPYIPNAYTVAYILAEIWEAKHPHRSMVDPIFLFESGHLATMMLLRESDVQSWLDVLTSLGVIEQMREAPPYQVVRRWYDKLDLLQKSYEED